jgi:hypothetical protein
VDDIVRDNSGRWIKGQSGNPLGKPRGESLTGILREQGQECPEGVGLTRAEMLAARLWTLAMGGDVSAIKYIYDRVDGAPRQTIETAEEGPLEIRITHSVDGI